MSENQDNGIAVFEALGWDLHPQGSQLVGDCPFCGGSDKMYVDPKTTKYDCKKCHSHGNSSKVLQDVFEQILEPAYSRRIAKRLSNYRGIPIEAYLDTEVTGYDDEKQRVVWAVRNPEGKVQGLRSVSIPRKAGTKVRVRNMKGCKLGLLGAECLNDPDRKNDPAYLCEGEWDFLAWRWTLAEASEPGIVLALPGAGNFNERWATWLQGRNVIGIYDNDKAGRDGTVRANKFLMSRAKSVRFVHWPDSVNEGYDCSDLVHENLGNPGNAISLLKSWLKSRPTGEDDDSNTGILSTVNDRRLEQEGLEPISVDELHEVFGKWLKLSNYDLLDVVMATMWSVYLPGNPLWMFVIAPPSGSKSETIMPASEWWRCHAVSNMTSKSLCSGFQLQGGGDPSLLSALDGARSVVTIKDLTPLLQGRPEERDEVFGILRDAYDGSVVKVFGNGVRRQYNKLHFALIAGVTPAIDGNNNVSMGERFLRYRADKDLDREDDIERAFRAVSNCGKEDDMRTEMKIACTRAMAREYDESKVPEVDPEFAIFISQVAYVVAGIRAVSPTERGSDLQTMGPMSEAPPRLAIQLVKFAQGLALHYEADTLHDPRIKRLVCRVALHTPDSISTRVIQVLFYWHSEVGMSRTGITTRTKGLGRETIRSVLERYVRIGIVVCKQTNPREVSYKLTDTFYGVIKETGIMAGLPTDDVYYRKDAPRVYPENPHKKRSPKKTRLTISRRRK